MPEFNFGEKLTEQTWRIFGVLPKGSIIGIVAPSMSAKSTLACGMFMHVLHDKDFLGKATEGCDVLLIDQDSQEVGLKNRVKRFNNSLKNRTHKLFWEYMQHNYFKDGSIYRTINSYPTAKVVFIDAFNKVGGNGFDLNGTGEVARAFEKLKTECMCDENSDRTIVILHHATEKREGMSADDYMSTQDHASLAMGNSAFVESLDGYYVVATPDKGTMVKSIFVRPISKRVLLPSEPYVVSLEQGATTMVMSYKGKWRVSDPESVQHVILYFKEVKETATINELLQHFDGQYKYNHLYKALNWLLLQGRAEYMVETSDRFRWRYIAEKDDASVVFVPEGVAEKLKTNKSNKTVKTVNLQKWLGRK